MGPYSYWLGWQAANQRMVWLWSVEKAENTLKNLEKYETNVKQMAENGRLQPLLTKLIEGMLYMQLQCTSLVANQSASSFSNTTLQFAKRITRLNI